MEPQTEPRSCRAQGKHDDNVGLLIAKKPSVTAHSSGFSLDLDYIAEALSIAKEGTLA